MSEPSERELRYGESSGDENSSNGLHSQIHEFMTARVFGEETPEQVQRLEKLLAASSEARRQYLCYIQETLAVRAIVGSGNEAERQSSPVAQSVSTRSVSTQRISALGISSSAAARAVVAARSPMSGFMRNAGRRYRRLRRDTRYAVAMALCLAFVLAGVVSSFVAGVLALVRSFDLPSGQPIEARSDAPQAPLVVARLTHVVYGAWAGDAAAHKIGDRLVAGSKLDLKSGLAEITFQDGAKAILEGPATLVLHGRNSAGLDCGKCAVTVEHPVAGGFEIITPGMKYTDLGTEFGVQVAQSGEQEVHVFRGKVQAEEAASERPAARSGGRNSAPSAPHATLLIAHEAIRVASPGKPIERMAADEKRFVREILDPFPIAGTGVGLDRGAPDPHWGIVAISTEANFKPQPAVVVVPEGNYVRDNRDTAQWVSNTEPKHNLPSGCRWTLRSHFDLAGFDASTARIEGQISADNYVVEIRVNGTAVPILPGNRDERLLERWLPLKIEEGFVSGGNTLEIVIENGDGTAPGNPNPTASPMAMCLELKGLARRLPNLKAEKEAR